MKNLFVLRKNIGLTQKDLAERLGISRQAYANYESGNREPDIQTLIKLSSFFDVSIDYLVGKSESVHKNENPLTQHEQAVITAYRNNPSMQTAVDKLLGIEESSFGGTPSTKKPQPAPVSVSHH